MTLFLFLKEFGPQIMKLCFREGALQAWALFRSIGLWPPFEEHLTRSSFGDLPLGAIGLKATSSTDLPDVECLH